MEVTFVTNGLAYYGRAFSKARFRAYLRVDSCDVLHLGRFQPLSQTLYKDESDLRLQITNSLAYYGLEFIMARLMSYLRVDS
jgi:hypothetical protein